MTAIDLPFALAKDTLYFLLASYTGMLLNTLTSILSKAFRSFTTLSNILPIE